MKRLVLIAELIAGSRARSRYVELHRSVWPEVIDEAAASGVIRSAIYVHRGILALVLDATDDFDPARLAGGPSQPRTREWQTLVNACLVERSDAIAGLRWSLMEPLLTGPAGAEGSPSRQHTVEGRKG